MRGAMKKRIVPVPKEKETKVIALPKKENGVKGKIFKMKAKAGGYKKI